MSRPISSITDSNCAYLVNPDALANDDDDDPLPAAAAADDEGISVVTVSETGAEKSAGETVEMRVAEIAGECWLLGTMDTCGEDGEMRLGYLWLYCGGCCCTKDDWWAGCGTADW